MSEIKKYLDNEGLKFLWSKISMEDYPNNDTLIAIINAIDQNKQDKITGTLNQIAGFDINGNLVSKDLDNSLSKEGVPADAKAVGDTISAHVTNTSNPHGVTASQIGAAASSHNQAASTITAGTFAGAVVAPRSSQTYSSYMLRNSRLASSETDPSYNGEICWTYE